MLNVPEHVRAQAGPRMLVVDAHNLLYRAFHALPPLTTPDGRPSNALYGFCRMLLVLLDEIEPDYVAVAMDVPSAEPSWRSELLPEYKATRPPMPDDLVVQVNLLEPLLAALGVPIVGAGGYEADDVMATLAATAESAGVVSYLATGDRDAYQLVADRTFVCTADRTMRGNIIVDADGVRERLGVPPSLVPDYKALAGDPSDNIAGVPGVGPKRAVQLLEQFGSLDSLLERAREIGNPRMRDAVIENRAACEAMREVAVLHRDLDLGVSLDDLRRVRAEPAGAREMLAGLGFGSLLRRFASGEPVDASEAPRVLSGGNAEDVAATLARLRGIGRVAVCGRVQRGQLVEVGLSAEGHAPVVLTFPAPAERTLFDGPRADGAEVPEALAAILADSSVRKTFYDAKAMMSALGGPSALAGVEDDLLLAGYLLAHGEGSVELAQLAARFLSEVPATTDGPEATAAEADLIRRLTPPITEQIEQEGLPGLYRELEMPLMPILSEMETRGVAVDRSRLSTLRGMLAEHMQAAEEETYRLAGERFTLGSPKQLQHILYEKLGLQTGRRTKTGFSTDADTLEELADSHEIVRHILEWRQLAKLQSTYVEALLALADDDGRVHTRFNQAAVVTGRLSSSDPNLQNIPVRTEWGREVRKCFVAPPGAWVLLSCDYSQVELRVLAHFARDPGLLQAFADGDDVHRHTASLLFDVAEDAVSRAQRDTAKTVNFGVVYGMGAVRLARDLGIGRPEAKAFIDRYFERYPGVKRYTDEVVEQARETGFVATLTGRRRNIPGIRSARDDVRTAAERAAVNTPIQGTAADLMKAGMIEVARRLRGRDDAHILLQVHDELLLEVRAGAVRDVAGLVCHAMAADIGLEVDVVVEAKSGANWGEMVPVAGE